MVGKLYKIGESFLLDLNFSKLFFLCLFRKIDKFTNMGISLSVVS